MYAYMKTDEEEAIEVEEKEEREEAIEDDEGGGGVLPLRSHLLRPLQFHFHHRALATPRQN